MIRGETSDRLAHFADVAQGAPLRRGVERIAITMQQLLDHFTTPRHSRVTVSGPDGTVTREMWVEPL